jgi:hypothetical protein
LDLVLISTEGEAADFAGICRRAGSGVTGKSQVRITHIIELGVPLSAIESRLNLPEDEWWDLFGWFSYWPGGKPSAKHWALLWDALLT